MGVVKGYLQLDDIWLIQRIRLTFFCLPFCRGYGLAGLRRAGRSGGARGYSKISQIDCLSQRFYKKIYIWDIIVIILENLWKAQLGA